MFCLRRSSLFFAFAIIAGAITAGPVHAIDGEVLITHDKALAGNVTPGDLAGYPVTLSLPGTYKFASNLAPGPGLDGIVVTSPDVTIDLNGFRLSGGPAGGANNADDGIVTGADRLTVKNGTIGAFMTTGIVSFTFHYLVVENMRVIHNAGNGGYGIYAPNSDFARIQNSTVALNAGPGIACGRSCHVEGNVVSGNGNFGVSLQSGTVLGNTILSNERYGIWGSGTVGFGNNTIINNGESQVFGSLTRLHPNVCAPVTC